jgi:hypothetical protein
MNVVKFPYSACRRVMARRPAKIEERQARRMGSQSRSGGGAATPSATLRNTPAMGALFENRTGNDA